jgi:hypothetical protein
MKWPSAAPRTRDALIDALATIIPVVVGGQAPDGMDRRTLHASRIVLVLGAQTGQIHPTYIPRPAAHGGFRRQLAAWPGRGREQPLTK